MKLYITGGGTGGHVTPGLAIARYFEKKQPQTTVRFAGSARGIENKLVPREGYPLDTIEIIGMSRSMSPKGILHNLKAAKLAVSAVSKAKKLLKQAKPDCVIGCGGYASFAVVRAAQQLGIPTVLLEVNALPGKVTQMLAKDADRVLVCFEQAKELLGGGDKIILTGAPVRGEILAADRVKAREKFGLTDDDLKDQYQYTKDIVTVDGVQKGTTWQATPGLFAYRRSIAKDVLGTDDPTEVQAALSDWDKFNDVAEKAAAKGYKMLSGYDDSYRTFSNNVSAGWVDGTTVKVDPNIMNWVDQTKTYTDNGYNNKTSLWSDQWAADQGPAGKVFGFFYSTWGINFTLLGNSLATPESEGGKQEVGNGIFGDYAVCQGPQPYYWGGTWICAAAGTDNISTIKDVMYSLTCDADIMTKITEDTQDYTNCKSAMDSIAADPNFGSAFLGGQNHIALFAEVAPTIDMSNAGPYDQGCNETFQSCFKDYFDGTVDLETAKKNFEDQIKVKYPELSSVEWPA